MGAAKAHLQLHSGGAAGRRSSEGHSEGPSEPQRAPEDHRGARRGRSGPPEGGQSAITLQGSFQQCTVSPGSDGLRVWHCAPNAASLWRHHISFLSSSTSTNGRNGSL
ncbi:hypothetical protein CCMA1212_000762 [Trichoderma ghanense]|uniref:Uncharacterized protein n=1 Tax=Trichoderma ghanense TaxID=65468 RepID=A0ABY2HI68_9HYPO